MTDLRDGQLEGTKADSGGRRRGNPAATGAPPAQRPERCDRAVRARQPRGCSAGTGRARVGHAEVGLWLVGALDAGVRAAGGRGAEARTSRARALGASAGSGTETVSGTEAVSGTGISSRTKT